MRASRNHKIYLMMAGLAALIVLLKSKKKSFAGTPGAKTYRPEKISSTKSYQEPDIIVDPTPYVSPADTVIRPLEWYEQGPNRD